MLHTPRPNEHIYMGPTYVSQVKEKLFSLGGTGKEKIYPQPPTTEYSGARSAKLGRSRITRIIFTKDEGMCSVQHPMKYLLAKSIMLATN